MKLAQSMVFQMVQIDNKLPSFRLWALISLFADHHVFFSCTKALNVITLHLNGTLRKVPCCNSLSVGSNRVILRLSCPDCRAREHCEDPQSCCCQTSPLVWQNKIPPSKMFILRIHSTSYHKTVVFHLPQFDWTGFIVHSVVIILMLNISLCSTEPFTLCSYSYLVLFLIVVALSRRNLQVSI